MKFAPMNVSQGVDVLYSTLEVQGGEKIIDLMWDFNGLKKRKIKVISLKSPVTKMGLDSAFTEKIVKTELPFFELKPY